MSTTVYPEGRQAPRFCVYELIDPRDGTVFYVGKGVPGRPRSHEIEARHWVRKGRPKRWRNVAKLERVVAIMESGASPIVRIIAETDSDRAALRIEKQRIKRNAGAGLTNIRHVRRKPDELRQNKLHTLVRFTSSDARILRASMKRAGYKKAATFLHDLAMLVATESELWPILDKLRARRGNEEISPSTESATQEEVR